MHPDSDTQTTAHEAAQWFALEENAPEAAAALLESLQ